MTKFTEQYEDIVEAKRPSLVSDKVNISKIKNFPKAPPKKPAGGWFVVSKAKRGGGDFNWMDKTKPRMQIKVSGIGGDKEGWDYISELSNYFKQYGVHFTTQVPITFMTDYADDERSDAEAIKFAQTIQALQAAGLPGTYRKKRIPTQLDLLMGKY